MSLTAFLLPVSAICLTRILFTEMSAVSEPEKNADSKSIRNIIKTSIVIQKSIIILPNLIINLKV